MKHLFLVGALFAASLPAQQLALAQAEELLLQRNQAIAAARSQVEVQQAMRRIVGYRPNPILHIASEQLPVESPVKGSAPRFFATNPDAGANPVYTAQVTKLFERGGKRELRTSQADAMVQATEAQVLDTFRTQLFQLRLAFTNAILARENLTLAQSIDREYAETERLTTARVNSGDLAAVELSRVHAGRLVYRQAILDATSAYQQATRDILNILDFRPGSPLASVAGAGVPPVEVPNPVLTVIGDLSDTPVTLTLSDLRERALRDRPDVVAAQRSLEAAQRGVRLAQAQTKRDLSVSVEYQRVGEDNSLGVVGEIPLFVYNNQKAGIVQAAAQQHVAESQLRQAQTQAITDVEKAYQAYLAAQQATAIYGRDGLSEAQRVRQVVSFSYSRGEASLFELLDAQRTATQAAVAANQARAAYQLALWQLEQAIGGSLR